MYGDRRRRDAAMSVAGLLLFMLLVAGTDSEYHGPRKSFRGFSVSDTMLHHLNHYRNWFGQPDVVKHPTLMHAAQWRAENRWGHDRYASDARAAGWPQDRPVSENFAWNYQSVEDVQRGWATSPGHAKNMRGDWKYVGLGYSPQRDTWYQMFGK